MRRSALLALLIVSGGAGTACNSAFLAKVAPPLSTATRPYYVRVAEALTSATLGEAMRVAPRMFSAYQIEEACRLLAGSRASRFRRGRLPCSSATA